MIDFKKMGIVARFELFDALRSKLVLLVVGTFAAGSAIGSLIFIKSMQVAEEGARNFLAQQGGLQPADVPIVEIKQRAIKNTFSSLENEGLRDTLLDLSPLAIFYGFAAIYSVPFLVLALSAGSHASDIQSGAARFALFRCSRPTWALGKLLGHFYLLATGLLVAALVSGGLGSYLQPTFESRTWADFLVSSLRALVFGFAYLGIFSGISLMARAPLRARAFSLFTLMALGVAHLYVFSSNSPAAHIRWLLPGTYSLNLWSSQLPALLLSVAALFSLGFLGFSLGAFVFSRRDA